MKRVKEGLLKRVSPGAEACQVVIGTVLLLANAVGTDAAEHRSSTHTDREQVPTWSAQDMEFFCTAR